MHSFTFEPPSNLPADVLSRKSTTVKVAFEPADIYVSAKLEAPKDNGEMWKAIVDFLPNSKAHPHERATLYVTRGEFGKVLGSVDLATLGRLV